jgi:hypothetical protein
MKKPCDFSQGFIYYPQGDSNPLPVSPNTMSAEQLTSTPTNALAHSLARESQKGPDSSPLEGAKIDPDLARLVDAWPTLPPTVKRMILAALEATGPG